jgi:hypothetical protein
MKTMGFSIDLEDLQLADVDRDKSPQELVSEILRIIIMSYGSENKGLGEEERRKYYKIADVLEEATKKGAVLVELEDEYARFIQSCRSKCKLLPNKLTQRVEALIDGIKEKSDDG